MNISIGLFRIFRFVIIWTSYCCRSANYLYKTIYRFHLYGEFFVQFLYCSQIIKKNYNSKLMNLFGDFPIKEIGRWILLKIFSEYSLYLRGEFKIATPWPPFNDFVFFFVSIFYAYKTWSIRFESQVSTKKL